jgi:hypothetical protein
MGKLWNELAPIYYPKDGRSSSLQSTGTYVPVLDYTAQPRVSQSSQPSIQFNTSHVRLLVYIELIWAAVHLASVVSVSNSAWND